MNPASGLKLVPAIAEQIDGAQHILISRSDDLMHLLPDLVQADNKEGIHQIRVAIRKFRTAIRDLEPIVDRKAARRTSKQLKRIAARAGQIRDHDVAMNLLTRFKPQIEDQKIANGLDKIIADRNARRDKAFRALAKKVDLEKINKISKNIRYIASTVRRESGGFSRIRETVLAKHRLEFLQLIPSIYRPFDQKGQHLLRIAAKNFRYSLETFEDPSDNSDERPSSRLAVMQNRLGAMHDCDTWIARLSKELRRQERHGYSDHPDFLAAEWLLSQLIQRRAKSYRDALELWVSWRTSGFFDTVLP